MRPRSLLRQIAIRLTLVTLGAIVLCYAWLYYQVRIAANRTSEGSLIAQARDIAEDLELTDGRIVLKLPDDFVDREDLREGRFRYSVTDASGAVLHASPWPTATLGRLQILDRKRSLYEFEHPQPAPQLYFGAVASRSFGDRTVSVQVERYSQHLDALMDTMLGEFISHGGWLGLPFLLALLGVSLATIRGAIAPLKAVSRQAESIGPMATDVRLSVADLPREIVPVVRAVNAALNRLEAGFRVQREFTADAAHELRTPLAVLRSHIDTLSDRGVAAALAVDVDRMARVVSQLLKVAQLDALAIGADETAELNGIALAVGEYAIPLALKQGKLVAARTGDSPCVVRGNAESIYHALRNLVENAVRHAPPGTTVELSVGPDRSVHVADGGEGIPPEHREQAFQRFWRRDASDSGAGLGLAIVRKTMELHGGTVAITETPGGGATFSLRFPAPDGTEAAPVALTPPGPPARARAAE